MLARTPYHTLNDINVCNAVLNLQKIRMKRQWFTSGQRQVLDIDKMPFVSVDHRLCASGIKHTHPVELLFDKPEQQYAEVISSYLWDYLRKCGGRGFFLVLKGDADSSIMAMLVYYMCLKIFKEVAFGNEFVLFSLRNILRDKNFKPRCVGAIVKEILHTISYEGEGLTSNHKQMAEALAAKIGSSHNTTNYSKVYTSFFDWAKKNMNFSNTMNNDSPTSTAEYLAWTSLQERVKMVLNYLCSMSIPFMNQKKGFLIVLSASNLDENLLGFGVKWGMSSADLNGIGCLKKSDILSMLNWFFGYLNWRLLEEIMNQKSSYECKKMCFNSDINCEEVEWRIGCKEMEIFSKFRNERLCGPYSIFDGLNEQWPEMDLNVLHELVLNFFNNYTMNRHKNLASTPAIYLSKSSIDSQRYDYRPGIYGGLGYQYNLIETLKANIELTMFTKMNQAIKAKELQFAIRGAKDGDQNGEKSRFSEDNYTIGTRTSIPKAFAFAKKQIEPLALVCVELQNSKPPSLNDLELGERQTEVQIVDALPRTHSAEDLSEAVKLMDKEMSSGNLNLDVREKIKQELLESMDEPCVKGDIRRITNEIESDGMGSDEDVSPLKMHAGFKK